MRTQSSLYALWICVLLTVVARVQASIYPVKSKLWIPPFQHAEKMFASDRGPILSRSGDSTIKLSVHSANLSSEMSDWRLVFFFYHVDSLDAFDAVEDKIDLLACAPDANADKLGVKGMANAKRFVFPVQNDSIDAVAEYKVDQSGWVDTQIFVCSDANGVAEVLPFTGTLEIRNPFGLLPAVLYGMLPFSALLSMGYFALEVFFVVLLIKHRKHMISLHHGIQTVLVMGIAASAAWLYAFYRMNKTGEPVCCPYPTTMLVAVVLDTTMRTVARLLLVVVCLGYGIVYPSLRRGQVALVALLSLAYFVSGVADKVTRGTSSGAEFRAKPTMWSLLQLVCNLVFIMWINFALEHTIQALAELKQSAKLAMYKALAGCLAGFVVFFTLLTLVAVCGKMGVFEWDVEWEWMQLVAWSVLNFIVSAAMCWIWRPTPSSSQLALSMQVPMDEKDAEEAGKADEYQYSDEDDDLFANSGVQTQDEEEEEEGDDYTEVEIELSPATNVVKNKQHLKSAHHDDDDDDGGL